MIIRILRNGLLLFQQKILGLPLQTSIRIFYHAQASSNFNNLFTSLLLWNGSNKEFQTVSSFRRTGKPPYAMLTPSQRTIA